MSYLKAPVIQRRVNKGRIFTAAHAWFGKNRPFGRCGWWRKFFNAMPRAARNPIPNIWWTTCF